MSETPEDLYYASSHEWIKPGDGGVATVGISDYAQGELGDVVFVELPDVDSQVSARDEVSVVESVKTASDIYAPVSVLSLQLMNCSRIVRRPSIPHLMMMAGYSRSAWKTRRSSRSF